MKKNIYPGDCVKISDERIAGVRAIDKGIYNIRGRRKTSQSHQFLVFQKEELEKITCPKGWMSLEGYNRYL
jgi:hypothetical protein